MKITVLREAGYEEAVLGFSLSYNTTIERAKEILPKYAFGKPGESKFLESIYLWLDVSAPRFWWQEADTYRLATKQSESTMHTLLKRELTQEDFEPAITGIILNELNEAIFACKRGYISLDVLKGMLPEGFIQRRIWCMNYKCLQNIYNQRKNHRLPQWRRFCNAVYNGIEHPEFLDSFVNREVTRNEQD